MIDDTSSVTEQLEVAMATDVHGWHRQAEAAPCCPTFSSMYELLPAVSEHVKV